MINKIAHFIGGSLATLMTVIEPNGWSVCICMTLTFIVYEINQQKHIHDPAYEEILEYLLGIGFICMMIVLMRYVG